MVAWIITYGSIVVKLIEHTIGKEKINMPDILNLDLLRSLWHDNGTEVVVCAKASTFGMFEEFTRLK